MHRKCRRFIVWLVLACAATSPALAEISVETTRLGHGVEAWYAPSEAVPVVDVLLVFDHAGSAQDPEGKAGRAAFTAAMLTEGAGTLDAPAFARALDAQAITLRFYVDDDRLVAHIYCLREYAQEAGKLLALALGSPTLHPADIDRVKSQFYSLQTQMAESPGYQASRLLSRHAFKGHPYANPTYGTASSIARLGAQDARDVLAQYITLGNITVSAAGDVNSAMLKSMLSPAIAVLSRQPAPTAIAATHLQEGGRVLRQQQAVPQTVITFAAPSVPRADPSFYTMYLLNEIMGGGTLTSRLSAEVRQGKGLVYSVSTDLEVKDGVSLLAGQLATRNSKADKALEAVQEVFANLRKTGVTPEECADAKSYVIDHFPLQLDRTSNLSMILYTMQHYQLGKDYLTARVDRFSRVSCEDINQLAREMLVPEKFLFAVVGGTEDKEAPPLEAAPAGGDAR